MQLESLGEPLPGRTKNKDGVQEEYINKKPTEKSPTGTFNAIESKLGGFHSIRNLGNRKTYRLPGRGGENEVVKLPAQKKVGGQN